MTHLLIEPQYYPVFRTSTQVRIIIRPLKRDDRDKDYKLFSVGSVVTTLLDAKLSQLLGLLLRLIFDEALTLSFTRCLFEL